MIDATACVVVVLRPQQIADEPLDGFVVRLTAFGAELPHALPACSLPMGKFAEHLMDEALSL